MKSVSVFLLHLFVLTQSWTDAVTLDDRLNCGPNDTAPATRVDTTERLSKFRAEMVKITSQGKALSAFIVGSEDPHYSEYPSDYDKRRQYISGFSGSAGTAVITAGKAALWTDGRYFLEADETLDCNWILMKSGQTGTPSIAEWLNDELEQGDSVGVDKSLVSNTYFQKLKESLETRSKGLALFDTLSIQNPVDIIWNALPTTRPGRPVNPVNPHPLSFAGKSWQDKITELRDHMTEKGADAFVVTSLDEVAWLFNLRGSDIAFNPFVLSYAIVEMDKVALYILDKNARLPGYPKDPQSDNITLATHLNTSDTGSCPPDPGFCVQVLDYAQSDVEGAVSALGTNSKKVWVTHLANYGIYSAASNGRIVQNSPIAIDKSIKNPTERAGMKKCYDRDSVVLIKFMTFLEQEIKDGKRWNEVSAAAELDKRRNAAEYSRGVSFETISAFASNGAVIHYRPSSATNKNITTDSLYLLDSGGQYLDGTTDVTRTAHYGEPTNYEKECYTRVLASSINLGEAIWPDGLYGSQIDTLARYQMWEAGLGYKHGTGHGVGAYLSIHEGPGSIGKASSQAVYSEPLKAYQYYSDEPGYYEDNKFGIRLETIVMVTPHTPKYDVMAWKFLHFTPTTLVPFEPNLIDFDFLTIRQINWLNKYNAMIRKDILPMLKSDSAATAWVMSRTEPYNRDRSSASKASLIQSSFLLSVSTLIVAVWRTIA